MGVIQHIKQAYDEHPDDREPEFPGFLKGNGEPASPPLTFEMRHAIPGRIRVVFPLLNNRSEAIASVVSRFSGEPGVTKVSSNRYCASITVEYDQTRLKENSLLNVLKRMTVEDLMSLKLRQAGKNSKQMSLEGVLEGRHERSPILWTVGGTFFVGMSVVGIVVPGFPTAPFVLLAASCYLRGSQRRYRWLLQHRIFGKFVEETESGVQISRMAKKFTVCLLWVSIAISCTFFVQSMLIRTALIIGGVGVSIYMLRK